MYRLKENVTFNVPNENYKLAYMNIFFYKMLNKAQPIWKDADQSEKLLKTEHF